MPDEVVHVGKFAYADIMDALDEIERRMIRMETRACKLMQHLGIDANGDPLINSNGATNERNDQRAG